MNHLYEKRGESLRLERWGKEEHRLRISEVGRARLWDGIFESEPLDDAAQGAQVELAPIDLPDFARFDVEQLSATVGRAEHTLFDARGERHWRQASTAVHLSLIDGERRFRAQATFGGSDWRVELQRWSNALTEAAGCRLIESPGVAELMIDRTIAAELVSLLAAMDQQPPASSVAIVQRPPHGDERDGMGDPIVTQSIVTAKGWHRPSYRFAPRRAALHVALQKEDDRVLSAEIFALAMTALPHLSGPNVVLELLCRREETVFFVLLSMPPDQWLASIVTISDDAVWFPALTGAWGATMLLRPVGIR